jgi:hypothetical protein
MRHEGDDGRLAQEGALTAHIRTREDDNLLLFHIQAQNIGHILFTWW